MRIDTHQHFWKYDPREYGWIDGRMGALCRDFLPAELAPLIRASGIDATIAVQARQSVQETEWLLDLADAAPWISAVVGWVDLCSDSVGEQLQRFSTRPKLRGVRHVVQDEPDDKFMLRPEFLRGLGRLRGFNLTYELLLYPRHLPVACEVVSRFPDQVFVLDHIAKPPIHARQMKPWADDLKRLAAFPNVSCKVSGMVTEADWNHWRSEDLSPYVEVVLEAFGAGRLMVGSDWPVCTLAGSYGQVITLASQLLAQLSANEQRAVWELNPKKFYCVTGQANAGKKPAQARP